MQNKLFMLKYNNILVLMPNPSVFAEYREKSLKITVIYMHLFNIYAYVAYSFESININILCLNNANR